MSIGWQLLPLNIHPIAFSIGFFSVSWYALCYFLGAFFVILALARSKRREAELGTDENFWTLLSFVLWGVLLGARLGYVVFYGTGQFWGEPWHIFSPYDFTTGAWVGIRGLSFFGGLFGGVVGLFLFVRKHQLSFLRLSDWIVPFLPIAIFMGRIGNFLNGELVGRPTTLPWGVYSLPGEAILRHPSQLYEAIGEGPVLFLVLFLVARFSLRGRFPGLLSGFFLVAYGCIRFFLEFFRAFDSGAQAFLGFLSPNQIFSLALIGIGVGIALSAWKAWYNGPKANAL